jgi:hypothetical protein
VVPRFPDRNTASNKLRDINKKAYILLKHLKETDFTLERNKVSELLLNNYDFDYLRENDPIWSIGHKAFTVDMKYVSICLRKKDGSFYPDDLLFFVFIHELSHTGTSKEYIHGDSHPPMFWAVMGFLLTECANLGLLTPINYEYHPVSYCNINISYNSYFDKKIQTLLD